MPKLSQETWSKRRAHIIAVAAELFATRGFHGVSQRDIAAAADTSVSNIYNYFGTKEDLFAATLTWCYEAFSAPGTPLADYLQRHQFPEDIDVFAAAMEQMVDRHPLYFRLIYVDAAAFEGKHVREHYSHLGARFGESGERLSMAYLLFATFYAVENLIGATAVVGPTRQQSIQSMCALFAREGVSQ